MECSNGQLWFLTSLFMSFIFFRILLRVKYKKNVALLYVLLSLIFFRLPILLPWSIDTAFLGALFMYLGFEVKDKKNLLVRTDFVELIGMIIVYCIVVYYNGGINFSVRQYGEREFASVLFIYIIGLLYTLIMARVCIIFDNTRLIKCLACVGKQSMLLLCIHLPIINLFFYITQYSGWYQWVRALLCLCITIFVSTMTKGIMFICKRNGNKRYGTYKNI